MADSADLVVVGAYFGTGSKGGIMSTFLMACRDPAGRWRTVCKVWLSDKCHACAFLFPALDRFDRLTLTSITGRLRPRRCDARQNQPRVGKHEDQQRPVQVRSVHISHVSSHTHSLSLSLSFLSLVFPHLIIEISLSPQGALVAAYQQQQSGARLHRAGPQGRARLGDHRRRVQQVHFALGRWHLYPLPARHSHPRRQGCPCSNTPCSSSVSSTAPTPAHAHTHTRIYIYIYI
jgi:hypothetical protein